jgi:FkbM family methyltransferase
VSDLHRSQFGQDAFVSDYIKTNDGVFFEAGAYDGESLSNTYYLEHSRGWTGILIEPMRRFFPEMHQKRPKSRIYNAALGGTEQSSALYLEAGDRSGIIKWMGAEAIQAIEGFFRNQRHEVRLDWVDILPLMGVLDESNIKHIDYFSLDIEGGELDILRSMDLSRVSVDLFGIEDNFGGGRQVETYLKPFGYLRLGHLGPDYFYIREALLAKLEAERGPQHIEAIYKLLA